MADYQKHEVEHIKSSDRLEPSPAQPAWKGGYPQTRSKKRPVAYSHLVGMDLPILFSGSVIIETIFSWPGLGLLSIRAVFQRDYQIVMALNMIGALLMLQAISFRYPLCAC